MSNLRRLASDLGLSITTVSRALDGYDDVAPATRERVLAAARIANYRPNAAARSLRRRRAETVAVVLPTDPARYGQPLFLGLFAEAGERLAAEGLDLVLLTARPGESDVETYRRLFEGRRADAAIVVRTRLADERVAYLAEAGIPFVTHGRTDDRIAHAFIDGDGAAGFETATAALIQAGHRRIAHVGAPSDYTFAALRRQGWAKALAAHDLADDLEVTVSPSETAGHQAARALLARPEAPTALVCATDAIAIGALRGAREAGLVPGRDLAVVGHDNIPAAAFADPPLSTMEMATREGEPSVGARLAELLVARIGGADPRELRELRPIRQVRRQT